MVGMVSSWRAGVSCGSRDKPLRSGVLLCGGQTWLFVGARVLMIFRHPLVCVLRGFSVCAMVNRSHIDLVLLERLVVLARRRFAIFPVGAPFGRVAEVFHRVMRLCVYMIRSPRKRI